MSAAVAAPVEIHRGPRRNPWITGQRIRYIVGQRITLWRERQSLQKHCPAQVENPLEPRPNYESYLGKCLGTKSYGIRSPVTFQLHSVTFVCAKQKRQ